MFLVSFLFTVHVIETISLSDNKMWQAILRDIIIMRSDHESQIRRKLQNKESVYTKRM